MRSPWDREPTQTDVYAYCLVYCELVQRFMEVFVGAIVGTVLFTLAFALIQFWENVALFPKFIKFFLFLKFNVVSACIVFIIFNQVI